MNKQKWISDILSSNKILAMPILTFPGIQKKGINVKELVFSSDYMADTMKIIADNFPSSIGSLAFMDLSVEAEAFGANATFSEYSIPNISGSIVSTCEDIDHLNIPKVGEKRTKLAIETITKAKSLIKDRPIFAGVIGSFSLAGRLIGVTEALMDVYEDEDLLHAVLDKCTLFLIEYVKAFKKAGADGVMIAEPLAGLLSNDLAVEFSSKYIKRLVDETKDDNFMIIYHNCGGSVPSIIDSILSIGADALHFGNAIDLSKVIDKVPSDVLIMGNIDPVGQFVDGTTESIYKETTNLLDKFVNYKNFVISSGCDIPSHAKWENIESFFKAVNDYKSRK